MTQPSIVRHAQAQPREYLGIRFELLAAGPQSVVTKMLYSEGNEVAQHAPQTNRPATLCRLAFA